MNREDLLKRKQFLKELKRKNKLNRKEMIKKDNKKWDKIIEIQKETFYKLYEDHVNLFDDYIDMLKRGRIKNMIEYAKIANIQEKKIRYKRIGEIILNE